MESPPRLSLYMPQKSKKRVSSGSSSTCIDEAEVVDPMEVVEIAPPVNRGSRSKTPKKKEVLCPEIINIDEDEDSIDNVLVSMEPDASGKAKGAVFQNFQKTVGSVSLVSNSGNHNYEAGHAAKSTGTNNVNGSHFLLGADDFGSNIIYEEDGYLDFVDDQSYDDQYAMLQSHFDELDIPPGIEVSIPWFTGSVGKKMKPSVESASTHSISQTLLDPEVFSKKVSSPSPPWILELPKDEYGSEGSSFFPSRLKKTEKILEEKRSDHDMMRKKLFDKPAVSGITRSSFFNDFSKNYREVGVPETTSLPAASHGKNKPQAPQNTVGSSKNQFSFAHPRTPENAAGSNSEVQLSTSAYNSKGAIPAPFGDSYGQGLTMDNGWNTIVGSGHKIPGYKFEAGMNSTTAPYPSVLLDSSGSSFGTFQYGFTVFPWFPVENQNCSSNLSGASSCKVKYGNPDDFMKKFDVFKRFDTIEDHSDHLYSMNRSCMKQQSNSWARKIQNEWMILEKNLPETIFVRVYESRMDLLRAVIIGAEGTPYHDGLFFFDVFFPNNYPNVPPHVKYHSGGLRINPNLYGCGKVCLSLLNTWSGSQKEKWIPGVSTILQVLVSIQGLILNAKPYFNEPGFANTGGTVSGERASLQYNENTFIYSLKTMVYSIRKPPKYFEDFVAGYFYKHAHDILVACKAYMDGAQVGCLVKGGVQDVDEGDKSSSIVFKQQLSGYIKTVVEAFTQVGAKDCEKFLSLAQFNSSMSRVPDFRHHV